MRRKFFSLHFPGVLGALGVHLLCRGSYRFALFTIFEQRDIEPRITRIAGIRDPGGSSRTLIHFFTEFLFRDIRAIRGSISFVASPGQCSRGMMRLIHAAINRDHFVEVAIECVESKANTSAAEVCKVELRR